MLLRCSWLLSISVCLGSAKSELGPIDTIDGLVLSKLYDAV